MVIEQVGRLKFDLETLIDHYWNTKGLVVVDANYLLYNCYYLSISILS